LKTVPDAQEIENLFYTLTIDHLPPVFNPTRSYVTSASLSGGSLTKSIPKIKNTQLTDEHAV